MNYYNDNNPYCAAWLRALIDSNLIPLGDVDERSIEKVQPSDLDGYTQCHFFSGLGGWPYALRLAGWPDTRPVWTGSCPCQPFSVAGKGKGTADSRHLWPHFHRLISACRPPVIMGEQVSGALGYGWFDGVASDLEEEAYTVGAVDIPAASVNAPHKRNRLYWIADRLDHAAEPLYREAGCSPLETLWDQTRSGKPERRGSDGDNRVADAPQQPEREQEHQECPESRRHTRADSSRRGSGHNRVADSTATGLEKRQGQSGDYEPQLPAPDRSGHTGSGLEYSTINRRSQGRPGDDLRGRGDTSTGPGLNPWSDFLLIGPDPSNQYRRIKPNLRLLAHGVPSRVAKLSALGNAIVPQLAAEVIRAYLETDL